MNTLHFLLPQIRFPPEHAVVCQQGFLSTRSSSLVIFLKKKRLSSVRKSDQITWLGTNCCQPLSEMFFYTSLLLLIRMSNSFSTSISTAAGAHPATPELCNGLKCWLMCCEQHTSYHTFSVALFVLLNRFWEITFFFFYIKNLLVDFLPACL